MAVLKRRQLLSGAAVAIAAAVALRLLGTLASASTSTPAEHTIRIQAFKFAPDGLSVKVGDRITWINDDIVPHTATAIDESWDSGTIAKGSSQTLTVTAGMSVDYFCRFHPMMKAHIDVVRDT